MNTFARLLVSCISVLAATAAVAQPLPRFLCTGSAATGFEWENGRWVQKTYRPVAYLMAKLDPDSADCERMMLSYGMGAVVVSPGNAPVYNDLPEGAVVVSPGNAVPPLPQEYRQQPQAVPPGYGPPGGVRPPPPPGYRLQTERPPPPPGYGPPGGRLPYGCWTAVGVGNTPVWPLDGSICLEGYTDEGVLTSVRCDVDLQALAPFWWIRATPLYDYEFTRWVTDIFRSWDGQIAASLYLEVGVCSRL